MDVSKFLLNILEIISLKVTEEKQSQEHIGMFKFYCFPVVSVQSFIFQRRELGSHCLQKETSTGVVDTVWGDHVLNHPGKEESGLKPGKCKEQTCKYLQCNSLLSSSRSSSSRNNSQDHGDWSRQKERSEPGPWPGTRPYGPRVPVPQIPAALLCQPFATAKECPQQQNVPSLKTARPGSSNTKTPAIGSSSFLLQFWPCTAWLTTNLYP